MKKLEFPNIILDSAVLDTAPCTTDTSKLLNSYRYNLGVIIILIDEKTSTYRYTYEHGKALISNKLVPKY